jgi:predicted PurR-regulated permease PerM
MSDVGDGPGQQRQPAGSFAPAAAGAPNAAAPTLAEVAADEEVGAVAYRRDRLLAALTLTCGILLALAAPFALRFGAEFFLPVTAALVIAVALVPLLEWLERRRVPSMLAALLCVLLLLIVANVAVASILFPAMQWIKELPQRIDSIRHTLEPLFEFYAELDSFIGNLAHEFAQGSSTGPQTVTLQPPNSLLEIIATSAPYAILQMFFAVLVIFFFLAGWTRMRKRTITTRASFDGAMTTARVIQQVVDATSLYLGTITMVNVGVGLLVAGILWALGMPTPLMWGGIVTLFNYVPYLGPVASVVLLAMGGLMVVPEVWYALIPAMTFLGIHLIEANIITPTLVGRRLTINPLLILVALSFWAWVWGTAGALLAVPLLIIGKTILGAAGKPDIAGFLFEEGTLIQEDSARRASS